MCCCVISLLYVPYFSWSLVMNWRVRWGSEIICRFIRFRKWVPCFCGHLQERFPTFEKSFSSLNEEQLTKIFCDLLGSRNLNSCKRICPTLTWLFSSLLSVAVQYNRMWSYCAWQSAASDLRLANFHVLLQNFQKHEEEAHYSGTFYDFFANLNAILCNFCASLLIWYLDLSQLRDMYGAVDLELWCV